MHVYLTCFNLQEYLDKKSLEDTLDEVDQLRSRLSTSDKEKYVIFSDAWKL